MPLDDFIPLRDLTGEIEPIKTKNGGAKYIANHPNHGIEVETTDNYNNILINAQSAITQITSSWQNKINTFTNNIDNLKEKFNEINYENFKRYPITNYRTSRKISR